MRVILTLLVLLCSCARSVPIPDSPQEPVVFYGRNIYSPTLINDGIHKMWYGGWQDEDDYPSDNIYYRTSTDNSSWSEPQTVLTPEQIPVPAVHVNDPSVTKHWNELAASWQYTMFYTVCVPPCNQSDNQIWSSVSSDGTNWSNHQLLLSGGAAEPSAVFEGGSWAVYYVHRLDAQKAKKAKVAGDRTLISVQTVYTDPNFIANVEVKFFDGEWHLFFNRWGADPIRGDIYKSVSSSNSSWSGYHLLIENKGEVCTTTAPGVLADGPHYDLYFGHHHRLSNGGCPLDMHTSIQRLRLT